MNAYELADKLEWHWDNDCRSPAVSKSADMLRQQADLIADLEKQVEHYKNKAEYLDKRELELLPKIRKYEEVLHAIANDYHELSDHKIEVQVRNHKKWAREALSLSGNNAEDIGNTEETLPKGKA